MITVTTFSITCVATSLCAVSEVCVVTDTLRSETENKEEEEENDTISGENISDKRDNCKLFCFATNKCKKNYFSIKITSLFVHDEHNKSCH